MFRMLIHSSSGACDLFDELFHGLYCSGLMRVGVMWYPEAVLQPTPGYTITPAKPQHKHQHSSNENNTTLEITQQISHKLLRMDVLTSETCWAVNNEIIKQVTSSWSLFIQTVTSSWFLILQLSKWCTVRYTKEYPGIYLPHWFCS